MQAAALAVRSVGGEWWLPPYEVTLWRFDLDHVGAEVGEELTGVRRRDPTAILEDGHTAERRF